MTKKTKENAKSTVLNIMEIQMGTIDFCVLGSSPLIMNRMAEKARQELLLPAARRNEAELQQSLKHDPVFEFRSAMYRVQGDTVPTRAIFPGRAFAQALAAAALDIPGAARAQIERLTKVEGINISIYGIPQLYMATVRQAGINKTPDIRTRPIFPAWAANVRISYIRPTLTQRSVANLFAAAGIIIGIGDDRRQKGGDHGEFRLVSNTDKAFVALLKSGGRQAQDKAIAEPVCYDAESEELLAWFETAALRREKKITTVKNETIEHNRLAEILK